MQDKPDAKSIPAMAKSSCLRSEIKQKQSSLNQWLPASRLSHHPKGFVYMVYGLFVWLAWRLIGTNLFLDMLWLVMVVYWLFWLWPNETGRQKLLLEEKEDALLRVEETEEHNALIDDVTSIWNELSVMQILYGVSRRFSLPVGSHVVFPVHCRELAVSMRVEFYVPLTRNVKFSCFVCDPTDFSIFEDNQRWGFLLEHLTTLQNYHCNVLNVANIGGTAGEPSVQTSAALNMIATPAAGFDQSALIRTGWYYVILECEDARRLDDSKHREKDDSESNMEVLCAPTCLFNLSFSAAQLDQAEISILEAEIATLEQSLGM
jgi:hypothetical protein